MKILLALLIVLASASCAVRTAEVSARSTPYDMTRTVQASTPLPHRPVQKPATRPVADESARALHYYDGASRRTVYLSSELVAEFTPSDAGRDALLAANGGYAEWRSATPTARVWHVGRKADAERFTRGLAGGTSHFSPVLQQGASAALPVLALPGGVIATFPREWARERIDAWLAARGLTVERELVAGSNLFLVPSEPGLASLELANELHDGGELVACAPNFWQEAQTR